MKKKVLVVQEESKEFGNDIVGIVSTVELSYKLVDRAFGPHKRISFQLVEDSDLEWQMKIETEGELGAVHEVWAHWYNLDDIDEVQFKGMKLEEFLELPEEDQWDTLWTDGVHLENFKSIDSAFQLYSLYSFYVDVEIKGSQLIMFPFKGGERLDKYVGGGQDRPLL